MNKYLAFVCSFLFTLTVALVPAVRMESERSPGQAVAQSSGANPTYEFDVLSGIQPADGAVSLRVTCRWHTGGCVLKDGVVPHGNALDLRLHTGAAATLKHPVYASFRHVSGTKDLQIMFSDYRDSGCLTAFAMFFMTER